MTNRTLEEDLAGLFSDKADLKAPATLRMRVAGVPDEIVHLGLVPRLALAAPRITRIAAVVVVLLLAAGSAWLRFGTGSPGAQGQALSIVNDAAPTPLPSGLSYSCPLTLTNMSLRVEVAGTRLVVVDATTLSPVDAVWPYGFSARLIDGKAELLASDGTVVAREGDVLTSVNGHEGSAGGAGGSAGAFDVTGFNGDCYTPSGVKVGSPRQPIPPVFSTGLGSQEP
jgi:hypothetical protein